jgi:hypothetical protein
MTWLIWRQHRGEAYVVGVILALFAVLLLLSGQAMASAFQHLGVGDCVAFPDHPNCHIIVEAFRQQYNAWVNLLPWLDLAPIPLAMLVGAPLVARELEHRTYLMVWTQSSTRFRWVAMKVTLILGSGLVVAAMLTLLLTWWRGPWDQLDGRFAPGGFDFEGIVPFAYVTFALALAIAAGALLRRTIPAMAVTVAGFLAIRLPIEFWARPQYQPARVLTWDPGLVTSQIHLSRADWSFNGGWVDKLGHSIAFNQVFGTCASDQTSIDMSPGTPFTHCTHAHGWLFSIAWQPADRFWLFQGIESAIFLGLAVALLALAIWWVRRRLA